MLKEFLIILLSMSCVKNTCKFKSLYFKQTTTIRKLLITLLNPKPLQKNTKPPLIRASKVKHILEAYPNIIDKTLIMSLEYRKLTIEMIKLLLNFIPLRYINCVDKNGEPLIFTLAFSQLRNEDLLNSLIKKFKGRLNINKRNKFGETALIGACQRRNISIVKFLVKNKANLNIQDRVLGYTALHWAVYKREQKIVDFLKANGADDTIMANDTKMPFRIKCERSFLN